MEKTTIRPIPLIITIIAVVGIAALIINAKRHPALAPTTAASQTSLCYVLNKPAGGTATGNDVAYLKINTSDGGAHVTGELGTYLAEKDGMSGTLTGTVTADTNGDSATFDGQYINSAEGMNNTNDQLIQLNDTQAQLGYGEMVQNSDGTYSYKDKSAVTYSLTIPNVDCAQYDSMKTAAGH